MEVEKQRAAVKSGRLKKIIAVASIAAGVQFGWALQLSLLTPYVQLLGIPHKWAALIWLCGPVSGMIVQPTVGYYSDRCTSRWGRRRPFIGAGTALVFLAVFLIGYAADFGKLFGDDMKKEMKPRAVIIFVIGFWILDVANNMLQGPCRALLADLSGKNTRRTRAANSFYSFFMAVGNVLGYAAGSLRSLHKMFPFTRTKACDVYCANLKSCFFLSIALLFFVTVSAFCIVREKPLSSKGGVAGDSDDDDDDEDGEQAGRETVSEPFFGEIAAAFKTLPKSMRALLLVTCLNWIAWFPFLLYDTDWMGKEVYGGTVGKGSNYDDGVRAGSLGLTLNSVVLGVVSLAIDPLSRAIGVKRLWGGVNFILAACLGLTVLVTKQAEAHRRLAGDVGSPPTAVKVGALLLFSVLGIPLAVTYSIPFALASIFSNTTGAGQGLSLGLLNVSIVVPQMVISVLSGPWDSLFGGGNLPAFVVGGVAAAISGLLALTLLPSPPPDQSSAATESVKGTPEAPR